MLVFLNIIPEGSNELIEISYFIAACYTILGSFIIRYKPSFELWLLLHLKKAEELDLTKIKENTRLSRKYTYIKKQLADSIPEECSFDNIYDLLNLSY